MFALKGILAFLGWSQEGIYLSKTISDNWTQIHNQGLAAFITEACQEKSETKLPRLLHYIPAFWAQSYKGVPGILILANGLRPALSN